MRPLVKLLWSPPVVIVVVVMQQRNQQHYRPIWVSTTTDKCRRDDDARHCTNEVRQTQRRVSYPDACCCSLAVLAQICVSAIESFDLYLILTNVRLELLAQPAKLRLVLGFNLRDRSLQLVDSALPAFPIQTTHTDTVSYAALTRLSHSQKTRS